MPKRNVNLRLDEDLIERLPSTLMRTHENRTKFITEAILEKLDREEEKEAQ